LTVLKSDALSLMDATRLECNTLTPYVSVRILASGAIKDSPIESFLIHLTSKLV